MEVEVMSESGRGDQQVDDFTAIDRPCAMTPPGYGVWVRVMVAEGFVPQRFLGCSAASVEED